MVTIDQLAAKYPLLWHMADPRNIPGILARGLISTSTLLDLLEIGASQRLTYERTRRADDVVFNHPKHGTVVLRDQKPLNIARLTTALTEGSIADFLAYINECVFFWPTEERLSRMNGARTYIDRPQLILVVRTASLLAAYAGRIRLSRINSGSTARFAAKRSIGTFQSPSDYDWTAGKRHVAEITIKGGVPDIRDHVVRLEVWRGGAFVKGLRRPWDASLQRRVTV